MSGPPKARNHKRAFRVVKNSQRTQTNNQFRFESFSRRIERLTIDPIRRSTSQRELDEQATKDSASYFKAALEDWKDKNLTDHFSNFVLDIDHLSESLPEILHHRKAIAEKLFEYIEGATPISLEPLLDLLTQYARDLGPRFEADFGRCVQVLARTASKSERSEVMEWALNSLVWIFKYLSRLLVQDLRPVYDLMASWLGKPCSEVQNPFVTRFAGEAFSFLLRKAATVLRKDAGPLRTIIQHINQDLRNSAESELFQHGIMTLFCESMRGVQRELHPSGLRILEELLSIGLDTPSESHSPQQREVLYGTVIALAHHCDERTFLPVINTVLEATKPERAGTDPQACITILFKLVSVRKGIRIADWRPLIERIEELLKVETLHRDKLGLLAVILQYCPSGYAAKLIPVVDRLNIPSWISYLVPFYTFFLDLDSERILTIQKPLRSLLSNISKTIAAEYLVLLDYLWRRGALDGLGLPQAELERDVLEQLNRIEHHDKATPPSNQILYQLSSELDVLGGLASHTASQQRVVAAMLEMFKIDRATGGEDWNKLHQFRTGSLLEGLVKLQHSDSAQDLQVILQIASKQARRSVGVKPFWQAVKNLFPVCARLQMQIPDAELEDLASGAISCLTLPSHDLRLVGLETLIQLCYWKIGSIPTVLDIACNIENSSFDLQSQRVISTQIRKLGTTYARTELNPWIQSAIPAYCFGLLHIHLASVWDDSCSAIKDICDNADGQKMVLEIASQWLRGSEQVYNEFHDHQEELVPRSRDISDFECSNLSKVEELYSRRCSQVQNANEELKLCFDKKHKQIPLVSATCRAQALRVLQSIPQVAERRSRILVPMFLDWVYDKGTEAHQEIIKSDNHRDQDSETRCSSEQRWIRKDQKAMATLFASFNNPRVLFQSAQVHDAFLRLLANGDVELQTVALKALITWKEAALEKYREQLQNLLDDQQFRDQLSVFLDVGQEDNVIEAQDQDKLMALVVRILYGRMISKSASSAKGGGLEARRKASLVALSRFDRQYMQQFLDIALEHVSNMAIVQEDGSVNHALLQTEAVPFRLQHGTLNMLKDMITTLGSTFEPMAQQLLQPTFYCLLTATKAKESNSDSLDNMVRSVLQLSMRCLTLMFEMFPTLEWSKYLPSLFSKVLTPRLADLPQETAFSVSGTLKLFSAWSKSPETAVFLSKYNDSVLPQIAECLRMPLVKDDVKVFVLNIFTSLVNNSGQNDEISNMLGRHGDHLLRAIESLLREEVSKDILGTAVETVSRLAPFIPIGDCVGLIETCSLLLEQPIKSVTPRTKHQILKTILPLLEGLGSAKALTPSDGAFANLGSTFADTFSEKARAGSAIAKSEAISMARKLYTVTSTQFGFFRDRDSRETLSEVFRALVSPLPDLAKISTICSDLNAFSEERLDEPDWDRRLAAFEAVRDQCQSWDEIEWIPVIHNLLYYIRDGEDGLRVNAGICLRRFIEKGTATSDNKPARSFDPLLITVLAAIKRGIEKNSDNVIRSEYLAVLAHMIKHLSNWDAVSDMHVLLVGDDEEASFFTNILHIQQHRRLRAMRRLAKDCRAGSIASENITHIFIPLIEAFIFEQAENEIAHNLAAEAAQTIGAIAQSLNWSAYKVLMKRYASYVDSKPESEKIVMKLLDCLSDALRRAWSETTPASIHKISNQKENSVTSKLARTMPVEGLLSEELTKNVLPTLSKYLHDKDEARISRRTPVALTIIKLLTTVPSDLPSRLPPPLMDLCNILKSRTQESRDTARHTLADIATLIGPRYFSFILKDMQRTLQRGYQMHVLSFTLHSLLVSITESYQHGELDYCVDDMISIIMDDIFGVTGQEKDAEGYISKMKEVKSSKSYDSMEIIAAQTTLPHLASLIRPIQRLLQERLNDKMLNKIDELLRRFRLGVLRNLASGSGDMLVFCYQLWTEAYKVTNTKGVAAKQDYKVARYLVKMRSDGRSLSHSLTTVQNGKLVRLAIDLMRDIVPKHDELQSPSRLGGFLKLIGDAIVSGDDYIKTGCFRLVASIIRISKESFPQLDEDAPVYAREAMRAVRDANSTQTELSQAAIKCATEIIAKRRDALIRDNDVAFLLKSLKNDLEEPSRQGIAFGFVRATVACKIIIPEVYEVMDLAAAIMVTNHSRETRQLVRSSYFSFLMDYPQAKRRLDKQIAFLVKNLSYEHAEGRQSVMEALHLLLTKIGDELVGDLQDVIFLPLVLTMVNDESSECRSFAQILLKDIFERIDIAKMKAISKLMLGWIEQPDNQILRQAGLQSWTLSLEAYPGKHRTSSFVTAVKHLIDAKIKPHGEADEDLVYYALQALYVWARSPSGVEALSASQQDLFSMVLECQFLQSHWVKLVATQLVGFYLSSFAKRVKPEELENLPLRLSSGLMLSAQDQLKIARANLKIFGFSGVSQELIDQARQNLAFIGRLFAVNHLAWQTHANDKLDGEMVEEISEDQDEIESSEDEEDVQEGVAKRYAFQYIIYRLAETVRSDLSSTKAAALIPRTSALQLLSVLCTKFMPSTMIDSCMPPILRVLHNLTDPSVTHPISADAAFTSGYEQLQESARELMTKLQNTLGPEAYLKQMAQVKKAALVRREDRRTKRRLESVNAPARAEAKKRRKRESGKERRKEKNAELRGRRRGW